MEKKVLSKHLNGILAICAFFFALPFSAHAATLGVSPSSGTYTIGKSFTVGINVSSSDQPMNAASGVVKFDSVKLEVASISKSGSIYSLWVQEPSFSNKAGTISFEGIVLNPGYKGSGGRILTITFKAKAAGDTSVSFASAMVLANDGSGTDILTGRGGAKYTLKAAEEPAPVPTPKPEPAPVQKVVPKTEPVPPAPEIPMPEIAKPETVQVPAPKVDLISEEAARVIRANDAKIIWFIRIIALLVILWLWTFYAFIRARYATTGISHRSQIEIVRLLDALKESVSEGLSELLFTSTSKTQFILRGRKLVKQLKTEFDKTERAILERIRKKNLL